MYPTGLIFFVEFESAKMRGAFTRYGLLAGEPIKKIGRFANLFEALIVKIPKNGG
jgi:hypothetical protein